jgi:hypothetical protein
MRERYLAAVQAHVDRVDEAQDVALALAPGVLDDMRRLAEAIDDGDLESGYALGWLHWYRYLALPAGSDRDDLRAAITAFVDCFTQGVEPLPEQLVPVLADVAVPTAISMLRQAMAMPGPEPILAVTDLWQRIVTGIGADDTGRPAYLSYLGVGLQVLSERTGSAAELDAAVEALRHSVAATQANDAELPERQHRLGRALLTRFELAGAPGDLDDAIDAGRYAAAAVPGNATYQWHIGRALGARFEAAGVPQDLDEAIEADRRAVAAVPLGSRDHVGFLTNLGSALNLRFDHTGDGTDLDAAIAAFGQAADADPAPVHRYDLAVLLTTRFRRTDEPADLDAAIDAYQQVLATGLDTSPARTLNNLGIALRLRFERNGVPGNLDAAVRAGQEALAATPVDDPGRGVRLTNLGVSLLSRFRLAGARDDLATAIALNREAAATPTGSPECAAVLNNLGLAVLRRFEVDGAADDIEEAVRIGKEAVAATPAGSTDRPGRMINLMLALRLRFEYGRSMADLSAAIELGQEAVDAVPPDHPDRAVYLSDLGTAFHVRYRRRNASSDLDAAVRAFQSAVDALPAGRPLRVGFLHNLGVALRDRFTRGGTLADLDAAITAGRQAVDDTTANAPARGTYLGTLDEAYLDRFGRTDALADVDAAVAVSRQAVDAAAAGSPGRAVHLAQLGDALRRRAERTGSGADEALAAYRGALADPAARPDIRISSARAGASLVGESQPGVAAELLAAAVGLLPDVAPRRLDWDDREHELSRFARLASEAASLALSAPTTEPPVLRALRLLESGRSLLLGERDAEPALSAADVRSLAEPGPIVVFNISRHRSDALLLTTSGSTVLPLPGLDATTVIEWFQTFRQSLSDADAPDIGWRARAAAQDELNTVLEWLWDAAAEPVLHALGYDAPPAPDTPWPRIWWISGGMLSLLPLHAAGYHRADTGCSVLDRIVSSHAPTVRALRHSRGLAATAPDAARALVVAMPTTPAAAPLPNAAAEADLLRDRIPGVLALVEPRPTRDTVLAAMADSSIVHFACHGTSDPVDPSRSALLLQDHETAPFTVADLISAGLGGGGDLAYLSACSTALMNVVTLGTVELVQPSRDTLPELAAVLTALNRNRDLLDEAIHLASAFSLVFRHVVGTLWEINDALILEVTAAFYTALRTSTGALDTDRSAQALHQAVRVQRDRLPRTPSLWASYLHAGP